MDSSVILRCQITALEYVLQVDYMNVEANEIEKKLCLYVYVFITP